MDSPKEEEAVEKTVEEEVEKTVEDPCEAEDQICRNRMIQPKNFD